MSARLDGCAVCGRLGRLARVARGLVACPGRCARSLEWQVDAAVLIAGELAGALAALDALRAAR